MSVVLVPFTYIEVSVVLVLTFSLSANACDSSKKLLSVICWLSVEIWWNRSPEELLLHLQPVISLLNKQASLWCYKHCHFHEINIPLFLDVWHITMATIFIIILYKIVIGNNVTRIIVLLITNIIKKIMSASHLQISLTKQSCHVVNVKVILSVT